MKPMGLRSSLWLGFATVFAALSVPLAPVIAQSPAASGSAGQGPAAQGVAAPATPPAATQAQRRNARPTPAMSVPTPVGPRNLQDALAAAYANNPTLQAARAKLRATDEGVPAALSGWRPTVTVGGTAGYVAGQSAAYAAGSPTSPGRWNTTSAERVLGNANATVTQPIYRGGRTRASTNQAENRVMAERARLIASEQQVFADTITSFVNVIQATQILALNVNNEQVLARQLQATQDRFRVGEITRTDVAQAEAALASATAQRQRSEGDLAVARSIYARVVGFQPNDLVPPQPLRPPVKTLQEAAALAANNNPTVVAALFDDAAAKDAVDVAFSALMPQVNVQTQVFHNTNNQIQHTATNAGQITANLSIPLYQGGAEYAGVRQARQTQQQTRKQVDEARRAAIQLATQAWETLNSARAAVESTRTAIRANRIALEGVTREALVGSRTTLDVLNAQQAVLNSEVTLVQNLTNLVIASHGVALATGRLTARDLNLGVPLYDETAYYNAVRDRWAGTGDYATDQPGR
jgi:outer membrane protein